MKSTIYSPNEQAFRNIDAELHALHQVEQSGVWRGNGVTPLGRQRSGTMPQLYPAPMHYQTRRHSRRSLD